MMLKKYDKAIILFIGFATLVAFFKDKLIDKKNDPLTIGGYSINVKPCLSVSNSFFKSAVDSVAFCQCLLPRFYEVIKQDSLAVKQFSEVGFFPIEGKLRDSAQHVFKSCLLGNILDTAYKVDVNLYRTMLTRRIKDSLESIPGLATNKIDSFSACILRRLEGRLTIRQVYSDDPIEFPDLGILLNDCMRELTGSPAN